jgi:CheY-like chemotaxis protein
VVGNLLGNAAKFTPRGGRVEVTLAREGGDALLRVRDDGEGIEPEVLRSLFQPFSQGRQALDRKRGPGPGPRAGAGAGRAARRHGRGEERGLGQGAEFTVRLPLEGAVADGPAARQEGRGARRRRLVVIEDNVDAADSLKEVLELMGHEVTVAYDGPSGLAAARKLRPEVLLCDIGLPGMDGYEVARAFRADEALRGTLLVALTGYALPEDLQRAQEAASRGTCRSLRAWRPSRRSSTGCSGRGRGSGLSGRRPRAAPRPRARFPLSAKPERGGPGVRHAARYGVVGWPRSTRARRRPRVAPDPDVQGHAPRHAGLK